MNIPFFLSTIKTNWKLLVIFTVITLAYLIMILGMYDPENLKQIAAAIEMAPPALAAAVGMDVIPTTLTDFIANYFYRFLIQLFLIVHVIILPIRLVAKYVDSGSMSYLLSTPNSRIKIATTQMIYLTLSLFVMAIVITGIALLFCQSRFPGDLDVPAFLSLNFATFLVSLAMGAVVFFFSCLMNEVKSAAAWGTGILVVFFVLSLVGKYGHSEGFYGVLERFSIFHLLRARAIVQGEVNMVANNTILLAIILIFFGGSVLVFKKKDLPL